MEGGEGVPAHLQTQKAQKRQGPIAAAKTWLTNKWLGEGEGPTNPAKRFHFKQAIGIGAATAVAVAERAVAIRALATGYELVKFTDAPDFRKHEYYKMATRDAYHSFTDSAVYEEKNDQGEVTKRYLPTAYISFGDSLAWGFVETYGANGKLVIDESKIRRCPADILCEEMNTTGATTNEGIPIDFERETLAYPGATTDNIAGQIQKLSQGLGENPGQYPPIAFDAVLAIGGNNALNYLGANLSLDVANNFKTEFIEKQFKPKMKVLIEGILALRTQGKDSPFLDNMKHLIVSGVPNLGASDQLYYEQEANPEKPDDTPSFVAVPMIPGLRGLATAACQYMNNAILDVIAEVQRENPDIPILFEDIFDVPVHGIHPTEEGYRQIAANREKRSRATFFLPPNRESDMTYRQYFEMKTREATIGQPI